ncbi:MAG: hypothetical protein WBA57_12055 [Elainellaceae cyanobacterium]
MSSAGLNKWIVSGNLAGDVEVKDINLKNGKSAKVAGTTLYVRRGRQRDESFTLSIDIWEWSSAWRLLPFLKKGSLIICTGSVEPSPYLSKDGTPKAGLKMTVLDIDLDVVKSVEDKSSEDMQQEAA